MVMIADEKRKNSGHAGQSRSRAPRLPREPRSLVAPPASLAGALGLRTPRLFQFLPGRLGIGQCLGGSAAFPNPGRDTRESPPHPDRGVLVQPVDYWALPPADHVLLPREL